MSRIDSWHQKISTGRHFQNGYCSISTSWIDTRHRKISTGLHFQNGHHNTAKIQHCSISKVAFDSIFKPVVSGQFGRLHILLLFNLSLPNNKVWETYCFCSVSYYYYYYSSFFPCTTNLSTADLRNYRKEFHETCWSYRYMFLVDPKVFRFVVKGVKAIFWGVQRGWGLL